MESSNGDVIEERTEKLQEFEEIVKLSNWLDRYAMIAENSQSKRR